MSTENRLPDYLEHLRREAAEACEFVAGLGRKDFLDDRRTQKAVIMSIIAIGEAVNRIEKRYPGFMTAHPEIPWHKLRGIRNHAAHGYFEINWDIVWNATQTGLPELLSQLSRIELT